MARQELIRHPKYTERLTLEDLAAAVDLHPDVVQRLVAYGLVDKLVLGDEGPCFDNAAVCRLRVIWRLRQDLGINLPGIAVVLDLLERLESLQRDLASATSSRN